jgi:hypothetical protein
VDHTRDDHNSRRYFPLVSGFIFKDLADCLISSVSEAEFIVGSQRCICVLITFNLIL